MFLKLQDMEIRPIRFDVAYSPGEIEFEAKLRQGGPLQVSGVAELLGATEEIRIQGQYQVMLEADCDRCLDLASFRVAERFDLFYRPDLETSPGEEFEIDRGEVEIAFYEGDGLELADVVREQVLLALPMQRLCREGCKGICPGCGANRNAKECGCTVTAGNDRWAALRGMKL